MRSRKGLAKKWGRLKPKVVRIPAHRGCEKKVWFDLDKDIRAVLVQKGGVERIYTTGPQFIKAPYGP